MAKVFLASSFVIGHPGGVGVRGAGPWSWGFRGSRPVGATHPTAAARPTPMIPGKAGAMPSRFNPIISPSPTLIPATPRVYYQQVPQATQGYTAEPPGRWIDRRQQRQQDRIHQGQASGQLTPREARRLHNEQAHIRGAEGRMRADGNLSPQERARLNTMQNRGSQDINRLRHNGVQPGPTVQPRPTGPGQPTAQLRPGANHGQLCNREPQPNPGPTAAGPPAMTAAPPDAASVRPQLSKGGLRSLDNRGDAEVFCHGSPRFRPGLPVMGALVFFGKLRSYR